MTPYEQDFWAKFGYLIIWAMGTPKHSLEEYGELYHRFGIYMFISMVAVLVILLIALIVICIIERKKEKLK